MGAQSFAGLLAGYDRKGYFCELTSARDCNDSEILAILARLRERLTATLEHNRALAPFTMSAGHGSAVSDVTIRSNRFENCNTSSYQDGDAIISIHPEIPKPGPSPFHSGIRIEDNTFIAFDAPILWAKSVHGLSFRGNTVVVSRAFEPFHANRFGLTFIDCEVVQVEGNRLETGYLGTQVKVEGGKPNSIRVKDWTANP